MKHPKFSASSLRRSRESQPRSTRFSLLVKAAVFLGVLGSGALARAQGGFAVMYAFTGTPDGSQSTAGLIQASDGNLYGTTSRGGTAGAGTIFQTNLNGTTTILHSFTAAPDGSTPQAGLIQASDGNLYGTTLFGGPGGLH